jgi:prepilin-type N-terminal cleavage/methylation domain-containing protein
MTKNHGFTLLELMIAIVIIAILSGFTIVGYIRWLPKYKLGSAVRNMQCTIQLARFSAVKENSTVTVEFDTSSDSCLVFVDDGSGGGFAGDGIQNGSEKLVKNLEMPAGIQLISPTFGPKLQFSNRGMPDVGGSIVMENEENSKTVKLLLSGKSSIL